MPSDLFLPIDTLIVATSVVFATSVVVGMILGRARLRRSRSGTTADRSQPAATDQRTTAAASPTLEPEPGMAGPAPHPRSMSRRWEVGRRALLSRRGTRPG